MECRERGGRGLVFPPQVTDAACTLKEFSVTLSARLLGVRSRAGRADYLCFRLDSGIVRDDEEFTCPARASGASSSRSPPIASRSSHRWWGSAATTSVGSTSRQLSSPPRT